MIESLYPFYVGGCLDHFRVNFRVPIRNSFDEGTFVVAVIFVINVVYGFDAAKYHVVYLCRFMLFKGFYG